MKKYASILLLIAVSVSSFAGKGFEKLDQYRQLAENRGNGFFAAQARLGTNILERCQSDPVFLDKLADDFERLALEGDNIPALALATCLADFAPKKGEALLLALAQSGDTDAMSLLAALYYVENEALTLKWLRQAAEKGDQDAIELLIVEYADALEKQEYYKYVKLLAETNCVNGLMGLASMYLEGDGVEVNQEAAVELLKKAWDEGAAPAGLMLAMYYRDKDIKTSLKWLEKAANGDCPEAKYAWADLILSGMYTEKDENEGMRWLRLSANDGFAPAQVRMGIYYFQGILVEEDWEIALDWLMKAAKQGDEEAQFTIGLLKVKENNPQEAYLWFLQASQQGHDKATALARKLEKMFPELKDTKPERTP